MPIAVEVKGALRGVINREMNRVFQKGGYMKFPDTSLRLSDELREGLGKTGYGGPETLEKIVEHLETLGVRLFLFPKRHEVTEEDISEGKFDPDMQGESVRPRILGGDARYVIEAYVPLMTSGAGHIATPLEAYDTMENLPAQFAEKILPYVVYGINHPGYYENGKA